MRITKEQLKRIIKEELEAVMEVGGATEKRKPYYGEKTSPTASNSYTKKLRKWMKANPDASPEDFKKHDDELRKTHGKPKFLKQEENERDPYADLVNYIRDNLDYIGEFSDMVLKNYLENEMEERGVENTEENFTALWNLTKNELNNAALTKEELETMLDEAGDIRNYPAEKADADYDAAFDELMNSQEFQAMSDEEQDAELEQLKRIYRK